MNKLDVSKELPLVSYVLTAYNIEEFIRESVQCAFEQTYENMEIVLSDDCSKDRTYDIMCEMARAYNGPHKIVLNRNAQNIGITKHMNKAYLELAHGEIIIAAHGDDISVPERTNKSVAYLMEHPEITAVSGCMTVIDSDGNELTGQTKEVTVSEIQTYSLENPREYGVPNIPAPSRAFRKTVMDFFGPLSDECPTEDELISFRALLMGYNAFLPDKFVSYRKHKGSSSNPENFAKFPLEKIREQQIRDMELAVQKGLLTRDKKTVIEEVTLRNMQIRKLYRRYFAEPTLRNLWRLICCPLVTFKGKLCYVREHLLRKRAE